MEKDLILTLDAGTTGCKCTVFNPKGEAVTFTTEAYETYYPQPNWAEQKPEEIYAAVLHGVRRLLEKVDAGRIACVGLSGTMNGCIPVDAQGNALYPNIIHSDARTEKQVEDILRVVDAKDFYFLTGNRADCHYTLPKILWLRENANKVYTDARWFLNIKDYLYGKMTDCVGYTDYSDASLTIALDMNKRTWAADMLRTLGLDAEKMPRLLASHDVHAKITRAFAMESGLLEGTPVSIGGGDGACTACGTGVDAPGSSYCYIGSSAWVSVVHERPIFDLSMRIFNYYNMDGEKVSVTGTVQCGAAAFNWGLENLLGADAGSAKIADIEAMARSVKPGAEGVLFLPTLMGWRTPYWDPNTKGCLMGFSLYHDRRHIARAVYEGVAYALNSCVSAIRECGGTLDYVMLAGGGALSGLWPDMLASVFGVKTMVHRYPSECSSLGAAIAAGVGVGIFDSYKAASEVIGARSVHMPNPEETKAYAKAYSIYADIYARVKPLNDRIANL